MVLLVLGLFGARAMAAEVPNHQFEGVLLTGNEGKVDPRNPRPTVAFLEAACGITVDANGDVLVPQYYRHRVDLLNLEGVYKLEVGDHQGKYHTALSEVDLPDGPCGLAVDLNGYLYVSSWHGAVVRYEPRSFPFPTYLPTFPPHEPPLPLPVNYPFYEAEGAVIDAGPSTGTALDLESGDLYVDKRSSVEIYKAPLTPGEKPLKRVGVGSIGNGFGAAFSASANLVYVADAADNTVKAFDAAGSETAGPVQVIDGAGTPQHGFNSLVDSSLAVDQSNGHLFVADNTQPGFTHPIAVIDEFNAEGLYRDQLSRQVVDGEPVGIAVSEVPGPHAGRVYVTSGNGTSVVFPPQPTVPEEETSSVLAFGPSGAGETLAVTKSGTGTGTVSSESAGIFCGSSCKAEFNSGKTVKLTATPDPGSAFAGWSGPSCSGTGPCSVLMSAAATVGAEFVPAPALMGTGPSGSAPAADAAGPAAPAGVAAAGTALLKLGRPSPSSSATVALEATASEPGAVTATAPGLQPVKVRFSAPGSRTLRLHLNRAGRRALARSKSGRLAFRVAIAFAPSGGASASVLKRAVNFNRTNKEER